RRCAAEDVLGPTAAPPARRGPSRHLSRRADSVAAAAWGRLIAASRAIQSTKLQENPSWRFFPRNRAPNGSRQHRKLRARAREQAEGPDQCGGIGDILEQADGGDAGGTCTQAFREIRFGDAPDGQHRNGNSPTGFGETVQALRPTERGFGRSGEDRAEKNVVGSRICGGPESLR